MILDKIEEVISTCQHAIKDMMEDTLNVLAIAAVYSDGRTEKHSEMTILPFLMDDDNLEGLEKLVITSYTIPTDVEPTDSEDDYIFPQCSDDKIEEPLLSMVKSHKKQLKSEAEKNEATAPRVKIKVIK